MQAAALRGNPVLAPSPSHPSPGVLLPSSSSCIPAPGRYLGHHIVAPTFLPQGNSIYLVRFPFSQTAFVPSIQSVDIVARSWIRSWVSNNLSPALPNKTFEGAASIPGVHGVVLCFVCSSVLGRIRSRPRWPITVGFDLCLADIRISYRRSAPDSTDRKK